MQLNRWQTATLIVLQLLFAACAMSVLIYRAQGWAPDVIDFGWLSYRAFNIYVSLALIGFLVWALLCRHRLALPLLAAFSLFHLIDGAIIAFWPKVVIHLITLILMFWIVLRRLLYLRRGRMPPTRQDGPIWYFAFGSNMSERLFRERRRMTPIETKIARLDNYRLRFAVSGRRMPGHTTRLVELIQRIDQIAAGGRKPGVSAPVDIVEAPGEHVWGVLYSLSFRDLARLDASEGRQYAHLWVDVEDPDGQLVRALTYHVAYPVPEGRPSQGYLRLIRTAAQDRGMPGTYVAFLDRVEARP